MRDRQPTVMVVADAGSSRQLCRELKAARPGVRVVIVRPAAVVAGSESLNAQADLIVLTDQPLSRQDFCSRFPVRKGDGRGGLVPAIVIAGELSPATRARLIEAGADALLFRPLSSQELAAAVETQLQRRYLWEELGQQVGQVLLGFAQAVEARDAYTAGHSRRVSLLADALATDLGLSQQNRDDAVTGALLHDVGKIGVPDAVLRKPGPLSRAERVLVQGHCLTGVRILEPMRSMRAILPCVRSHHERWDGKGYPDGLAGEAIPLTARVVGLADGIEAMLSTRPYRLGRTVAVTESLLRRHRGRQWDRAMVECALDCGLVELGARLVYGKQAGPGEHPGGRRVVPSSGPGARGDCTGLPMELPRPAIPRSARGFPGGHPGDGEGGVDSPPGPEV
ncbi:MAG: HD domain-containing protein [bacterium]|nr:HD domain-containing protein [bacterium]